MEETRLEFEIGHPAPHRARARTGPLLFALGGAALGWALQFAIAASSSGLACREADGARLPEAGWAGALMFGADILALALGLAALGLALAARRRTRAETHPRAGDLMDAGEGRTRFLAVWGIWGGALFLLAIAVNAALAHWGMLCPG